MWGLTRLPHRPPVLGRGSVGCEPAQSFARWGAQVTQVETAPRVMGREDEEVPALVAASWRDVLAMEHGSGLNEILRTIHTCPTMSEANKYVAGACERVHAPTKLLPWVGRCHAWERP